MLYYKVPSDHVQLKFRFRPTRHFKDLRTYEISRKQTEQADRPKAQVHG